MSEESLDKHYQDCPGCLCDLRAENERLLAANDVLVQRINDLSEAYNKDEACPRIQCQTSVKKLRAENEQLKKTILSSSDLYEKLVYKQLQAERELADELADALRECMTWWDDEFYDSDTALKKYDERRAMDEEQ